RRRALVGAGGLAAAAAVGAFLVPLAGGSGDTAVDNGIATDPSSAASTKPSTSPSPTTEATPKAGPFVARTGWWDMPASEMATRLKSLLPSEVRLESYAKNSTYADPELDGALSLRSDPDAVGGIRVALLQQPAVDPIVDPVADPSEYDGVDMTVGDYSCPGGNIAEETTLISCETLRNQDGTLLGRIQETVHGGIVNRQAKIVTAGGVIYVATVNATGEKWETPSGTAPLLTLDQALALAESSVWTDWDPAGKPE
ncbi:hypothetical protein, partial [Nocardioides sp.]|uniref:hypothetical protein n=1 Tax=Nocardioides sp. TaxID=35761 RepID=UPI0039E555AB